MWSKFVLLSLVQALMPVDAIIPHSKGRIINDPKRPLQNFGSQVTPSQIGCQNDYCQGANQSSEYKYYVCGDWRLGPSQLPKKLPLSTITSTYDRFGGLCPEAFLAKWTNAKGAYNYPPGDGFLLNTAGAPIQGNVTLLVGARIDRFGAESGAFASPQRAPYSQRSLPPSNLDSPSGGADGAQYPFNYHVYEVKKEFAVLAGPIAPWFGQPGLGTQYKLKTSLATYVQQGFLLPVKL